MLIFCALLLMAELEVTPVKKFELIEHDIFLLNDYTANVAVAPDGGFAIYDSAEDQGVLFSADGALIKRVGRSGQGPGEFQFFGQIRRLADARLWAITDWGNARVSMWSPRGELKAAFKIPLPATGGGVNFLDRATMVYADFIIGAFGTNPQILRFDLNEQKSIQLYEHQLAQKTPVIQLESGGVQICDWDPKLVYDVGGDFIAVAFGGEGAVRLIDFKGKAVGQPILPELERFPVTDEDVARQKERLPRANLAAFNAHRQRPAAWPLVAHLMVDAQDQIWVFGAKRYAEHYPVVIYTRDGVKIAQGKLKRLPAEITKAHLYYIDVEAEDELILVKASFKIK